MQLWKDTVFKFLDFKLLDIVTALNTVGLFSSITLIQTSPALGGLEQNTEVPHGKNHV